VPGTGLAAAIATGRLALTGLVTALVAAWRVIAGLPGPRAVVLDVHVNLRLVPRYLRLRVGLAGRGPGRVGGRLALGPARGVGDRVARGAGPRPVDAVPVGEPPGDEPPVEAAVLGGGPVVR